MSPGTKVFLAVFGLLIGALVLYYTTLPDATPGPITVDNPQRSISDPLQSATPPPASPRPRSTVVQTPKKSPLGQSVADAAKANAGISSRPLITNDPKPKTQEPPLRTLANTTNMTNTPVVTAPPPPPMVKYKVKPGETMSSIASDWFGTATKWSLIAEANPLVDPMRMRDGIILKLPPKSTGQKSTAGGTTPPRPPTGTYVVKNGDSLSTIAQEELGSASKWRLIYDANRLLIGSDPDDLELGMTLVIPR